MCEYKTLVSSLKFKLKDIEFEDAINNPNFNICQLKYDGFWALLDFSDTVRQVQVVTSNGNVRDTFQLNVDVPRTQLICEWMFGTTWGKAYKADHSVDFIIHDAVMIDGLDIKHLSYQIRNVYFWEWLHKYEQDMPFLIEGIADYSAKHATPIWDRYVLGLENFEGLVWRNNLDAYGYGVIGRTKKTVTNDYVFMGMNEGNGKYVGVGGSVRAGLYVNGELTFITSIGGLSDAQRHAFWANREHWSGKRVFEANGKKLFKSGALRHPNFLRFRDDKTPEECVLP